jgi:hypothetical protein
MTERTRISVWINPMRLFEWDDEPTQELPADPTPERLLQYLSTLETPPDMKAFKKRYRTISKKDQQLVLMIEEPELIENLFRPLRHAKTSYLLGNFVGTIALCGLVAEKVAILIHALNSPAEAEREAFEAKDQSKRVEYLKQQGLATETMMQDFGAIRAARKDYLHYWTPADSRVAEDAIHAFGAAVRLVLSIIGFAFNDGKIGVNPKLVPYLKARGAIRQVQSSAASAEGDGEQT